MDTVLSIIQNFGFPVACCVFLGYFLKSQNDQYREDVKALAEKHEENTRVISSKYEAAIAETAEKYDKQIEKFAKSIDRNTQVLTALEAKLEKKGSVENA